MTDLTTAAREAVWPYSTLDEVSHLACEDVPLLRARIDQLLEERSERREAEGRGDVDFPPCLKLTSQESRVLSTLVTSKGIATKERLHTATAAPGVEPETDLKLVDVIVCKVRRKLQPHGLKIETVWGRGYKVDDDFKAQLALL